MMYPNFLGNPALSCDTEWLEQRLAFHESGHAVVAAALNVDITVVSIVPAKGWAGCVMTKTAPDDIPTSTRVLFSLAGPQAERKFLARYLRDSVRRHVDSMNVGEAKDMSDARRLVAIDQRADVSSVAVAAAVAQYRDRATRLVNKHWDWIFAVAGQLLVDRELSGADVLRLRPKHDIGGAVRL